MLALRDVNGPEPKQPYGKQAKHATAAYLANRDVVVRDITKDQEGRTTADILLNDGRNIAHELVKEGLAWVQPGEVHDPALKDLEELARASKHGLWSEPALSHRGSGNPPNQPVTTSVQKPHSSPAIRREIFTPIFCG